eukprot:gene36451-44957_t
MSSVLAIRLPQRRHTSRASENARSNATARRNVSRRSHCQTGATWPNVPSCRAGHARQAPGKTAARPIPESGPALDNGFARRRGVLKMNIRTSSEFLLLHRAPPLGWTGPRSLRGKGITSRPSPPKYVSPPPTVILGPTTRPLRVAVRTRLTDASTAPSQPGTACAVAVRAEWSIENLGDGIAVPMQPDLPVRSITPRWRTREKASKAIHAFRASAAHGLKERIGREAAPTTYRRVTTATGCDAGQRRIENAMFKEAGPCSDRRIGGENGVVKARGKVLNRTRIDRPKSPCRGCHLRNWGTDWHGLHAGRSLPKRYGRMQELPGPLWSGTGSVAKSETPPYSQPFHLAARHNLDYATLTESGKRRGCHGASCAGGGCRPRKHKAHPSETALKPEAWGSKRKTVGPDVHLAADVFNANVLQHDRYCETPEYLALLLGALHYMQVDRIDLLVVGLPVATYKIKSLVAALERRLTGEHELGKGRRVKVVRAKALAQPAGADALRLIVDPGRRTFDWLVTQGMQQIDKRSHSVPRGMHDVLQTIIEGISRATGSHYRDYDTVDYALRTGKKPVVFQQEYDLARHLPLARKIPEQAIAEMMHYVGDASDIRNIILVGGGAFFYRNALKGAFPNHTIHELKDTIFANVKGFQQAGMELARTLANTTLVNQQVLQT